MHPRRSENQSFWLEETNKAKSVEGSSESLTGSGFALKTKKKNLLAPIVQFSGQNIITGYNKYLLSNLSDFCFLLL